MNSLPLYTIGIPTYNRAAFLRESLTAALSQTYPNLEVLVCDNASTDDTAAVVASFSDPRVRYLRHDKNQGAEFNFIACVKEARGEFFSWLQDDDIVFCDFAARAATALSVPNCVGYFATAITSPSPTVLFEDLVYGPPQSLDWVHQSPSSVERNTLLGVALFVSYAIPPVIAFKTEVLRRVHVDGCQSTLFPLYHERYLLVEMAEQGTITVAPHIAGVFRYHPQQRCVELMQGGVSKRLTEWKYMAEALTTLAIDRGFDTEAFQAYLEQLPSDILLDWHRMSREWIYESEWTRSVLNSLMSVLRTRGVSVEREVLTEPLEEKSVLKKCVRSIVPPLIWEGLAAIKKRRSASASSTPQGEPRRSDETRSNKQINRR